MMILANSCIALVLLSTVLRDSNAAALNNANSISDGVDCTPPASTCVEESSNLPPPLPPKK